MALNLNDKSQLRILNLLLQKDTGERYIKYFKILDNSILNKSFSYIGSSMLLELIVEFYSEYGEIPDEGDFVQYCLDNSRYSSFVTNTHPQELEKFRIFESQLFESVAETKYLMQMVRDFIIQCQSSYFMHQKFEELKELEKSPKVGGYFEIHQKYNRLETYFMLDLEKDLSNEGRIKFVDVMREHVDVTTLEDSVSVHIFGTLHMYLGNIAVLMSPAKFWKTGFTILTGVRTSELGYETAFLDLENGFSRLLRRVYQRLTKVTKNEVRFNLYLNRDILHKKYGLVLHNSHLKDYEDGQITYDLIAVKDREGNEQPHLVFKQCEGLSADGGQLLWTNLEGYQDITLEDVTEPYQPLLDKAKEEFREKGGGGFHLAHAKGIKPKDIRAALATLDQENEYWREAKEKNKRVLVIDWMLLMEADNAQDSVWLKSNDIYASLQKIAQEENLYIIAIEGVANPEDLKKWDVDLAAIQPKFNKGIDYNAAHVSVLAASEEEKPIARRMYAKEDRDGSSGTKDDCAYYLISPQLMQAKELSIEEHQSMFPSLWGLGDDVGGGAEAVVTGRVADDDDDYFTPPTVTIDIPRSF